MDTLLLSLQLEKLKRSWGWLERNHLQGPVSLREGNPRLEQLSYCLEKLIIAATNARNAVNGERARSGSDLPVQPGDLWVSPHGARWFARCGAGTCDLQLFPVSTHGTAIPLQPTVNLTGWRLISRDHSEAKKSNSTTR